MVQLIAEQQMNANNNGKSRYDNVIRRLVLLRYTETEIVISFRDVYIYIYVIWYAITSLYIFYCYHFYLVKNNNLRCLTVVSNIFSPPTCPFMHMLVWE